MKRLYSFAAVFATAMIIGGGVMAQQPQRPQMPKAPEPAKTIELFTKIPGAKGEPKKCDEQSANIFFMRCVSTPQLAYFPAKEPSGASVIVIPGGGYAGLTYLFEGLQTAEWLASVGINAFVLKYRLPEEQFMQDRSVGPLIDAQQAVRYVRANAKEYGIDPDKIGVIGFSAGGHLASVISTHYNDNVYKSEYNVSARPDFSILIYPVITMEAETTHMGSREALIGKDANQALTDKFSSQKQVTKDTPPAFLAHALDDKLVPYANSVMYTDALRKNGVEAELHLYAKGDHGLQVKAPTDTQAFWHDACEKWMRMHGWIK